MIKHNTDKQNSHYARLRRLHRENNPLSLDDDVIYLYGYYTVLAALQNKNRIINKLMCSENGLKKLPEEIILNYKNKIEILTPKNLSVMLGDEAVHQGIVAIAKPLKTKKIMDFLSSNFLVLLDQITDPHNIGAIMRTCVAMQVDALISTVRYSAKESGVLAKSASGALDMIDYVTVKNLANTIEELQALGFYVIGLDSDGDNDLVDLLSIISNKKIALILGSEGRGLREKTKLTSNKLARLDMKGKIKSLNVSNAAAISLYITAYHLKK